MKDNDKDEQAQCDKEDFDVFMILIERKLASKCAQLEFRKNQYLIFSLIEYNVDYHYFGYCLDGSYRINQTVYEMLVNRYKKLGWIVAPEYTVYNRGMRRRLFGKTDRVLSGIRLSIA